MSLIELRNISKTYQAGEVPVPVLKGVSISVNEGDLIALTGASGSGKSTLMNIVGCLDRADSGDYFLEGREVSKLSPDDLARIRNRTIGFVFQNFNLLPRMSALDNVIMPLSYSSGGGADKESKDKAEAALALVGLADRMKHEPSQLSGGQQQRVAIARALINSPRIILADEPTGNLDSRTSADVLEMFKRLNEEEGITMLLVTHDAEVASHAKRIVRIRDGIVEHGSDREWGAI